ncbi:hypothetical protein [Haloarcula sp. Atlit-7R]|nr:hypothetical protein [Haloarcula sp. Atlit-7R]
MIDELVEQAEQAATEIEDVAAANEEQATKVREINESVQRLTRE